ncbi:MAG: hypothetical protein HQL50_11260 [Magnetococcales bacterium]|nr:hypothetical protein [Magnetococcales bacterium]
MFFLIHNGASVLAAKPDLEPFVPALGNSLRKLPKERRLQAGLHTPSVVTPELLNWLAKRFSESQRIIENASDEIYLIDVPERISLIWRIHGGRLESPPGKLRKLGRRLQPQRRQ